MTPLTAADPQTRSADLVAENVARLRELLPEAFTEGKIDFDVLKQLLGGVVDERDEKYGLNWHGKRLARQLALTPSTGTLRPVPGDGVDEATTQNIVIEGDNLEVLKLLQKSYSGKVKTIYIDPPYNTGKDFVYPDNFQDNIKNYLELTGQVEGGAKITSNPESSGRFHTDWLNMIYPRLQLAKHLLREDGCLFVSVDDSEAFHLRMVCDSIYGAECYKGTIVRTTGQTTGQDSGGLGSSFDYVVVYVRTPDTELSGLALDDNDLERYQEEDSKGKYALWQMRKTGSGDRRTDRPNMYYSVKAPDKSDILPIGPTGYESRWRFDANGYKRLVEEDAIVWKKRGQSEQNPDWWPYVKTYLEGRTKRPSPLWDDLEGSKKASIDNRQLMGDSVFNHPKPLGLITRLLQIVPNADSTGIVLDFFAGSGTTGHAVIAQNAGDGGTRRYILVQLPEPLDPENKDQKTAATFCDSLGKPRTIAELTKERLRRAANKVRSDNSLFTGDVGFRTYKLDSSNIRVWEPDRANIDQSLFDATQHLKSDRTEADILIELLLKLGLDLCVPIQMKTIAKKPVHSIGAGVLIVCLDPSISRKDAEPLALGIAAWHKELKPAGEATVVFRDNAFADDVAKTNLAAILTQHHLTNVRSL
jgi:adenine-specific DNA-methyltransferase